MPRKPIKRAEALSPSQIKHLFALPRSYLQMARRLNRCSSFWAMTISTKPAAIWTFPLVMPRVRSRP